MGARPLKLWPFLVVGISSVSIAKISLHPRLKLLKDPNGWTLRYDYLNRASDGGPTDRGLEIANAPRPRGSLPVRAEDITETSGSRFKNTHWVLDTGANAHMCTNRDLLHGYSELQWGQTGHGFKGANGKVDQYVGVGDCTMIPLLSGPAGQPVRGQPLTLQRVLFYPSQGVNLLSWSSLKRGAQKQGIQLKMVEREDWTLEICVVEGRGKERPVLRFKPMHGLFVLDQVPPDQSGTEEAKKEQGKAEPS